MAHAAFGTTLKKGTTPIAELTKISGPALAADTIDVSSHSSVDGYREFVQGLKDGGEVAIEGNFTNEAGQAALITDFHAGTVGAYTITLPTTTPVSWTFSGIVTALNIDAPFDGVLAFQATLKVSGKPVLA
ncbi:MAG: phage tail tube protein [Syntrophomonadaceae bacterium]|nr:phage tail tube protein [Syntrophomonadaceae bacterium]